MNATCLFFATALLFGAGVAEAQTLNSTNRVSGVVLAKPAPGQQPAKAAPPLLLGRGTNLPNSTIVGRSPDQPHTTLLARKSQDPALLEPGIYKTAPYTCIVIAPEHHADDQMIIGSQATNTPTGAIPMPTIKPELRFIPR